MGDGKFTTKVGFIYIRQEEHIRPFTEMITSLIHMDVHYQNC